MEAFKNDWVEAAQILAECGFDAILIHSGHSCPWPSFSPDQQAHRRVRRIHRQPLPLPDRNSGRHPGQGGQKLLIEVRISGTEFEEGGIDLEEGIRIGERIQDHLDILQVSAGMHNPKWMTWVHPAASGLPALTSMWRRLSRSPAGSMCPSSPWGHRLGGLPPREILSSGKADLVTMARL